MMTNLQLAGAGRLRLEARRASGFKAVLLATTALVGVAISPAGDRAAAQQVWNGPGTNYNLPGNWSTPADVPDTDGETAVFGAGGPPVVDLSAGVTVGGVTFQVGAIGYTLGSASGSILTIAPGGLLSNQSGAAQSIDLIISGGGGVEQTGTGSLTLSRANTYLGPTTVTGGTLTIAASGSLAPASTVTNSAQFTNAGTVGGDVTNLVGGTVTSTGTINGFLTNAGTVNASGTVGEVVNSGIFRVTGNLAGDGFSNNPGALLSVDAGRLTLSSTLINDAFGGPGQGVQVADGAILAVDIIDNSGQISIGTEGRLAGADNVAASTVTLSSANAVLRNLGTAVADLQVLVAGAEVLNAGQIAGSVTLNAGTFTQVAGGSLSGLLSNNGGLAEVQGAITGTVNNADAFVVTGALNTAATGGSITVFSNSGGGTLTVQSDTFGNGSTGIVFLQNDGTVTVDAGAGLAAGTIVTTNAFTNSGTVTVGAGGLANSGAFANNVGASIVGVVTNTGGTFTNDGSTGAVANTGGTFTNAATGSTGNVTNSATFINDGGTVNGTFSNTGTASGFGTITGLTSSSAGTFTVTGGTLTAAGFNNAGSSQLTVASTLNLGAGTLSNLSTAVPGVTIANGAIVTAAAFTNGGTAANAGTVTAAVTNAGNFTNQATGAINGSVTNNNAGAVFDNAGTITGNLVNTNGTFSNGIGALLDGTATITFGLLSNAGGITGLTTVGTGAFALNAATGTMAGVANAGTFTNNGSTGAVSNTDGTFTNNSTTAAVTQSGGTFTNNGATAAVTKSGGTFANNGATGNVSNTGGTFTNAALATTGDVTNSATFDNSGTVGAVANSGGTFTNAGTTLAVTTTGGTFALAGGTVNGTLLSSDGTVSGNGTVTGLVTNSGAAFTVTGGTLSAVAGFDNRGTGALTVAAGSTLDLAGATLANSSAALLGVNIQGTLTAASFGNGGTARNSGTVAASVTNSGAVASFVNVGTINGAVSNAAQATFQNTGAINGAVTNTGPATFASTGTINGAVSNLGAGARFTASGTIAGAVANTGVLILGGDLAGVTTFDNGGILGFGSPGTRTLTATTFNNQAGGTINLVNGSVTDRLTIAGAYDGAAGSRLATDVDLSQSGTGQRGDLLVLSGATTGTTAVTVSPVNGRQALLAAPIPVVQGTPGATFTLAGGLPGRGIIRYDFEQLSPGTYGIVSSLDPNAASAASTSIASLVTGINVGFFQPSSAFIGAPADPAPNTWAGGPWVRVSGGDFTITSTGATLNTSGMAQTAQSKLRTNFGGFQVGGDVGLFNIGGSGYNVHLGVTSGQVTADTKEKGGGSAADFDVPFVGAYAAVTGGPLFADFSIRKDYYRAEVTNPLAGLSADRLRAESTSVNGSVGYRFDVGSFFVEPSAALSWTRTEINELEINIGTLQFRDIESVLGRVGARVGTTFLAGEKLALQPFATASVWHEFKEQANSQLVSASFANSPIIVDRVGTFGQVGLGLSGQLINTGLLGYVRGDVRFGDKIDGKALNAGVRYQF